LNVGNRPNSTSKDLCAHTGSDKCRACERPLFGDAVRSRAHGWFRVVQVKALSVSSCRYRSLKWRCRSQPWSGDSSHWQTAHVQHVTCTLYFSYITRCHMQKSTDGRKTNTVGPSNSRPGHSLINTVSSVCGISLSHVPSDCLPMGQCSDEI
jgi:hypothetical protein